MVVHGLVIQTWNEGQEVPDVTVRVFGDKSNRDIAVEDAIEQVDRLPLNIEIETFETELE